MNKIVIVVVILFTLFFFYGLVGASTKPCTNELEFVAGEILPPVPDTDPCVFEDEVDRDDDGGEVIETPEEPETPETPVEPETPNQEPPSPSHGGSGGGSHKHPHKNFEYCLKYHSDSLCRREFASIVTPTPIDWSTFNSYDYLVKSPEDLAKEEWAKNYWLKTLLNLLIGRWNDRFEVETYQPVEGKG